MPTIAVLNMQGQEVGQQELNEAVFGIEPNVSVMNDMVKNYLANQRQGTQSALTRSEVSGGGKKPWRQKGTGRIGIFAHSQSCPMAGTQFRADVFIAGQGQDTSGSVHLAVPDDHAAVVQGRFIEKDIGDQLG